MDYQTHLCRVIGLETSEAVKDLRAKACQESLDCLVRVEGVRHGLKNVLKQAAILAPQMRGKAWMLLETLYEVLTACRCHLFPRTSLENIEKQRSAMLIHRHSLPPVAVRSTADRHSSTRLLHRIAQPLDTADRLVPCSSPCSCLVMGLNDEMLSRHNREARVQGPSLILYTVHLAPCTCL